MPIDLMLGLAALAAQVQMPADATARLVEACVAPADRNRTMDSLTPAERQRLLVCATRFTAGVINAQLPQRLDEITSLQSVEALGVTLVYNNRVEVDAAAVTGAQRQALERSVRQFVCGQADMTRTIGYGGSYRYVWSDRKGAPIHRVTIDGC